jgi:hypothetical protein
MWTGCSLITGVQLKDETVTAACGSCIFKELERYGCYWAIEWDGDYYPVNGQTPLDHNSHGPEGMCTMPRKAVVSGKLRSGQFFVDAFELLPVDPADVPANPPKHDHAH